MDDFIDWHENVTITIRYQDGTEEVLHLKNMVMNCAKNMMRDGLKGTVTDFKIKYVALGSSTTAVANTQTQLGSEQFRKAVTQQSAGGTGVLTTTSYIASYEGNSFTIEEIGWFAGSTATASANSGVMVARVLYHRAKTNLESITITRDDTLSAA